MLTNARHPGEDALSNADWPDAPLARLEQMVAARDYLAYKIEECVGDCRKAGLTWAQIGEALGVTRQGAQKFYGPWIENAA